MKKKALIIGALPEPFKGPWVTIDDHDAWRIVREHEYGDDVIVQLEESHKTFKDGDLVSGMRARAVIREFLDVPHVSVWLEAANAEL